MALKKPKTVISSWSAIWTAACCISEASKVKIVVAADLKTFKVSTTTSNGLQTVDVYGKETMSAAKEQLEYIWIAWSKTAS